MSTKREAARLRKKILELTGHEPVGASADDVRYLSRRLGTIEARIASGEDVRHRNLKAKLLTISMPELGRKAFAKLVDKEKTKASDLARRALAFWAREHGYPNEANEIEGRI